MTDIDLLVDRLSVEKANLDDVHAFMNDTKEKLNQYLADRITKM